MVHATSARLSELGACVSIPTDHSTMDGVNALVNEIQGRETFKAASFVIGVLIPVNGGLTGVKGAL